MLVSCSLLVVGFDSIRPRPRPRRGKHGHGVCSLLCSLLFCFVVVAFVASSIVAAPLHVPTVIAQERVLGSILVDSGNQFGQLELELGKNGLGDGHGRAGLFLGKEPGEQCGGTGPAATDSGTPSQYHPQRGQKSRHAHGQDAHHGSQVAGYDHGDEWILCHRIDALLQSSLDGIASGGNSV